MFADVQQSLLQCIQRPQLLLVLLLGSSVLPSETRDVADVYWSLRCGASGWIVEQVVFLFRKFHFHPISIFRRVNHDSMGRQGRLDLPVVGFRLRSVVFSAASPLL